jgi:hypothetical protein
VTTYGVISRNWDGMGTFRIARMLCSASANPNTSAAANAPTGFQRPKIMAASAMNPRPAVMFLSNPPVDPSVKYAPPSPAMRPPRITFR